MYAYMSWISVQLMRLNQLSPSSMHVAYLVNITYVNFHHFDSKNENLSEHIQSLAYLHRSIDHSNCQTTFSCKQQNPILNARRICKTECTIDLLALVIKLHWNDPFHQKNIQIMLSYHGTTNHLKSIKYCVVLT